MAVNAEAAAPLLALAQTGSLGELDDEAARARAAHQDLEARRQAVHRGRGLRSYSDAGGTWHLHALGRPEDGAMVMAAIGPLADKAFASARAEGRRERPEAYAFDALVALASGGAGPAGPPAPRAEVLFRVDHDALLRGYPVDGEVCEVAGFGPVSTQAVLDLLDCGDPILKAVVTKGKDVVNVAHLGRRPNAHQQSAAGLAVPHVRRRRVLDQGRPPADRPPPGVVQEPLHHLGPVGPAVPVPPLPQDLPRLGAGARPRQAGLRPSRAPQAPSSLCWSGRGPFAVMAR